MEQIKPKKLKKGDTIGILAVSGRIKEPEKIHNCSKFFNELGYKTLISDTCYSSHRYMAGNNDDECINALHSFFLNDDINAIICARGGYGTLRLINKINWNIVRNNPKIFAGYSDITVLLSLMYKKCGLITFHSAMANGDFGSEIEEYTKDSFFNTLSGKTNVINAQFPKVYYEGIARGIIWGGNLASLVSLCGTDFIPDEDIILFLEDLNEPVYKTDKMLTQLFNIDKIRNKVKGIAFGEFKDIDNRYFLDQLFKELANDLKIPIADGFKMTHNKVKDTIPYGIKVNFDSQNGKISFIDNYVI